ncbi:MAG: TetR/AcrR family transcriptional regulator [Deferribacteres bacterium]|nr:TetR/AcrR family transcriptional regulator [candidate division KSB1 bacterium]MCB9504011.1 TetR/AcrR family transcriptional regulator [Deferribacteres bacterium]
MPRIATKKNDILHAALALFMKKGIRATTTKDIAMRADISEGTIYRHFESKDELANQVFEKTSRVLYNFLKEKLALFTKPEEQLNCYVRSLFDFARKDHKKYSFLFAAHQTELRRQTRKKTKHIDLLVEIIILGQEQGVFRAVDQHLAATMVLGTITQTIFYLKNGDIKVNFADIVPEVQASCLKILN